MQTGFEKRFNQGDIVYWCHNTNGRYIVKYGMVDEQFSDAVVIDYLVPRERRFVNGIPIDEFDSETKYKNIDHVSIRPDKVYFTYETAFEEADKLNKEIKRQASLTDYEWSVEQIEKTLWRWKTLSGLSEEEMNMYKEWLLHMENVEDIETRIYGGQIQWKYADKKRWNYIEL